MGMAAIIVAGVILRRGSWLERTRLDFRVRRREEESANSGDD